MRKRIAAVGILAVFFIVACRPATADRAHPEPGGPVGEQPREAGGTHLSSALGEPELVTATGATTPTVAVSVDGADRYVVWASPREPQEGGGYDVLLAHSGSGAAGIVRVNDVPGDAAPHGQAPPVVATGPGAVYVLWQTTAPITGRRFPASELRFARSEDRGATFAPAINPVDDRSGVPSSHTFHDMTVAADGTVYVAWIDSRVRDALRAHGAAEEDLPGPEIRLASSTDGGRTFSASAVVDSGACPCCRVALAAGPAGTIYAAWRKHYEGDVRDVVVARSGDRGRRFEPPVRVHDDGWVFPGCPHAGPALALDDAGTLHVGWYTAATGKVGLYHATSRDGGRSFGAPLPLEAGAGVPPSVIRLAAAGDGAVVAIWERWENRRRALGLARINAGGALVPLPGAPATAAEPALTSSAGTTLLAWLEGSQLRRAELAAR